MSKKSKLPEGVTVWKGKKKYRGECPEHIFEAYKATLVKSSSKKSEPEVKKETE